MQPNQMSAQMTEEQAIQQIKLRKANLIHVLEFKTAENKASREMLDAIEKTNMEMVIVFPQPVINAYKSMIKCRIAASDFEVAAIQRELSQADQLLAQASSPILVPGRARVMTGGGIKQF